MNMTVQVPAKRGRPFGKVYRTEPYFPEKVAVVRKMHAEGYTFEEIGEALEMSRAGAYYLWHRWIRNQ